MKDMIDQILNQQTLKKMFKLLLSVSIFFCSYYSSSLSYFFHSQVSTIFGFYIQYHSVFDRNYMFLVCNGILVFLGLVGSSSIKNSSSTAGEVSNINGFYSMNVVEVKEPDVQSVGDLDNVISLEEEDGEVGHESMIVERAKEEQNGFFLKDEEEEELNEKLDYFTDEVEEGNRLSTEELNKKFDDFIRKVKEEIRIEAQQHLIMAQ